MQPTTTDQGIIPGILYTPSGAAQLMNVTERWLQLDRSTHRTVPFIKLGSQVRYQGKDLLASIEANRIGGEVA